MQTHMHTHKHMQTHAHITPRGEDVCEEGMSEFLAPENVCAKHFSLFPMQQHSSININSGPLRASDQLYACLRSCQAKPANQ